MDDQVSFLMQWRQDIEKTRSRLLEKAKSQPLTEVEEMILNPFTAQQARDQVKSLNQKLSGLAGKQRRKAQDT